jgi:hypothetical protein
LGLSNSRESSVTNQTYQKISGISRGDVSIFIRQRTPPFEPAIHWMFAKIVEPLEKKPWGLWQFTLEDLDGNRFYIHHD